MMMWDVYLCKRNCCVISQINPNKTHVTKNMTTTGEGGNFADINIKARLNNFEVKLTVIEFLFLSRRNSFK